jgi:hypothetical protein
VAADDRTSPVATEPSYTLSTTKFPNPSGTTSIHPREKVENSESAAIVEATCRETGSQPIARPPSRRPDGNPTSISPGVILIMMSLFAIPQILMTVLSIAMFSLPD